jgi:hypothetical protein
MPENPPCDEPRPDDATSEPSQTDKPALDLRSLMSGGGSGELNQLWQLYWTTPEYKDRLLYQIVMLAFERSGSQSCYEQAFAEEILQMFTESLVACCSAEKMQPD